MPVILRKSNAPHWKVPADLAIDPRASALADRVAAIVLKAHKQAIVSGVRADDGSAQPALDPKGQSGRAAAKGKRPNVRGHTARPKAFPRTLRRGKTEKARGDTNATVVIQAAGIHAPWLEREAERGVQYLFTTGEVAEAIERATFEWLDEVTRPSAKRKR
jgi:hypothetical protein